MLGYGAPVGEQDVAGDLFGEKMPGVIAFVAGEQGVPRRGDKRRVDVGGKKSPGVFEGGDAALRRQDAGRGFGACVLRGLGVLFEPFPGAEGAGFEAGSEQSTRLLAGSVSAIKA